MRMKHKTLLFILTFLFCVISLISAQKSVMGLEIKYHSYKLKISRELPVEKEVPFIVGEKFIDNKEKRFGLLFSGERKEILSHPLIELYDANTQKRIGRISLQEYSGLESKDWRLLKDDCITNDTLLLTTFLFTINKQRVKFQKKIEIVPDMALPLGKSINVSFTFIPEKEMNIDMKLNLKSTGKVVMQNNLFAVIDTVVDKNDYSAIIIKADNGSIVSVQPKSKTRKQNDITISVKNNQIKTEHIKPILTLQIVGTTVEQLELVEQQVKNLFTYFTDNKTNPDIVATTISSKTATNPGDTVKYIIVYNNIGTAQAVGININNPIPIGTKYIEESAEGVGSFFSIKLENNNISSLNWEFKDPIYPGERREVSYKLIIQ